MINAQPAEEILGQERKRNAILDELGDSASQLFSFLQEHGASSASDEDLLSAMGWTRARDAGVDSLEEAGLAVGRREKGGRRKLYELTSLAE